MLDGDWSTLSDDEQMSAVRLLRKALRVDDDSNITLVMSARAATLTHSSGGPRRISRECRIKNLTLDGCANLVEQPVNAVGAKLQVAAAVDEHAPSELDVVEGDAVESDGRGVVLDESFHPATVTDPGAGAVSQLGGAASPLRPGDQGQDPELVASLPSEPNEEGAVLEPLDNYDWAEAFGYAGEPDTNGNARVSAAEGSPAAADSFTREDVVRIVAMDDGQNDGPDWVGVFELRDGRFAFVSAGCDYTGWDCQASGAAVVSHDLDHLIRFGLGDEDRKRLSLPAAAGNPNQPKNEGDD
jgi:hypothetical protein